MRYYLKIYKILCVIIWSLLIVGDAYAWVALPTLSIKGSVRTKAAANTGNDDIIIEGGTVAQVNYRDGTSIKGNNKLESIINAEVLIKGAKRTGDYTFAEAVFIIRHGNFTYLKADLADIELVTDGSSWYINPRMDVADGSTMNLKNIRTNVNLAHPSRYIEELDVSLQLINKAGIKIIVTPSGPGDVKGDFLGTISSGLLAAPLYLSSPIGIRAPEYWEKHYIERGIFGYDAVSDEVDVLNFFPDKESLDVVFLRKSNKTLLEEAKTQLATLLLNIAAGLDPSTTIHSIYTNHKFKRIPQADGLEDSVKDAVIDIENTLLNFSKSKTELERVKNLAENINNNIFQ